MLEAIKKLRERKKAKKAAIDAAPGTSRLEKRLNVAGAEARKRKAERQEKKGRKKSNRAIKRSTIESMPGNTMLEKRLNFAGAKARARKADRQESKKLKKEGPVQQTSRKIKMPSKTSNVTSPQRTKIPTLDRTADMTFDQAFAAARKAGQKRFEWRGKSYSTKLKGKAMYGASMKKKAMGGASMDKKKMPMYADGGKLKEVPSDNKGLGKLPKKVRNKMGYAKHGGGIMIVMPVKKSKKKAMYGAKMKKKY